MLHKQMELYIEQLMKSMNQTKEENGFKLEMFKEEKEYAESKQLLPSNFAEKLSERNPAEKFSDAYIERGDKETESFIGTETPEFLENQIGYLLKQKNEFLYVESKWFDIIGVDAVSIEADDVFGTYDVMLGLKLPKKMDKVLKEGLEDAFQGDKSSFDVLFNGEDGLWNVNFALNNVEGFSENMTIREAYVLIYQFLFVLLKKLEEDKG